ncbi:hypothetical protein ACFQZZ_33100 [Nocardia sp. GCM10030253]|uniref:hypothetical protein n=1 Tax=Nocardia sp. GCM10030253 TaxID=3273404 RepID=UPI0036444953
MGFLVSEALSWASVPAVDFISQPALVSSTAASSGICTHHLDLDDDIEPVDVVVRRRHQDTVATGRHGPISLYAERYSKFEQLHRRLKIYEAVIRTVVSVTIAELSRPRDRQFQQVRITQRFSQRPIRVHEGAVGYVAMPL